MTDGSELSFPDRMNWLTVEQAFVLNEACRVVREAFGDISYGVYQVGSSLFRPTYRDVDVRCIVEPDKWNALFGEGDDGLMLKFLNVAISGYLRERTGLPIDFQFQHQKRANAEFPSGSNGPHRRNALGHGRA
ncbi:MAG TPA: hypothetical protein VMI56_17100 [Reyranella sp.]|nr:hypothetical protein [Reyranella sp.]